MQVMYDKTPKIEHIDHVEKGKSYINDGLAK